MTIIYPPEGQFLCRKNVLRKRLYHIDGLVEDCCNSTTNALELLQSYTNIKISDNAINTDADIKTIWDIANYNPDKACGAHPGLNGIKRK